MTNVYTWLDTKSAVECGDSLAFFPFDYNTDLVTELTTALHGSIRMTPASRFYVIYRKEDGKHSGKFIVGKRKPPPWSGFGSGGGPAQVDES